MATTIAQLTLTSTDLLSDNLALATVASITASSTNGLKRSSLKSTSKVTKISCLDGATSTTGAALQGQFIDVTDNHGLRKKYVIIDGNASSVATGTIIASGTDIGSNTPANLGLLDLVGGIAIDVPAGQTQHSVLTLIQAGINHANGHNGSITAANVSGTGSAVVNITLTNPTAGESGVFLVDADNSNLSILSNTTVATSTNSGLDHTVVVNKNDFTSPAFLYVKNTADYHASNNIAYLYYDNHGAEDVMEIRGGQFAYIPLNPQNNLKAYTSTIDTIIEHMVIGTNA